MPREPATCMFNHTVYREFLEPVCDDCIVAEAKDSPGISEYILQTPKWTSYYPKQRISYDSGNGQALILESNVEISLVTDEGQDVQDLQEDEVVMVRPVAAANVEPDMLAAMQDSLISIEEDPVTPRLAQENSEAARRTTQTRPESSLTTGGNEADDEGSLHISSPVLRNGRCRLRTRSKEVRRQGMDVSREELRLRIASGWTSGERKTMEHFKRFLKGEEPSVPKYDALSPAAQTQTEAVNGRRGRSSVQNWAKDVAKRVGRSLGSRSRIRQIRKERGRRSPLRAEAAPAGEVKTSSPTSSATEIHSREQTSLSNSSVNTIFEYGDDVEEGGGGGRELVLCPESWEDHLKHDLGRRGRTRHEESAPQSVVVTAVEEQDHDHDHRMASAISNVPSIPMTSSATSSVSVAENVVRLAQELSCAQSDQDPDYAEDWYLSHDSAEVRTRARAEYGNHETIVINDVRGECLGTRRPQHDKQGSTSITSTPELTTTATATPTITLQAQSTHPLTTPLRLSSPVRMHPAPPRRSSSLFPPPASSTYYSDSFR